MCREEVDIKDYATVHQADDKTRSTPSQQIVRSPSEP